MGFVGDFIGDVVGGITGTTAAAEGAERAAATQAGASTEAIAAQERQFDKLIELMSPYVAAGPPALEAQKALIGLGGPGEQEQIISTIAESPEFLEMIRQGEEGITQGAAATGGLRGGNIQSALAQFRPQMLSNLIERQYARLGGLTSVGQASAAGQAAAGQSSAGTIADLLQQRGAATAGGQLATGAAPGMAFSNLAGMTGGFFGAGGIPGIKKSLGF